MAGLDYTTRDKVLWIALLALCLASAAAYVFWALPTMPETVPTHWGVDGAADGWSDKGSTIFMGVIMPILMLALLFAVPFFDPRGASFNRFKGIYQGFSAAFTVFMIVMAWLTPATALGLIPESGSLVNILVFGFFGLLLVTVFSKIGKMITDMIMDMSGMSGLTSYSDYSEMLGLSQMYDFPLVKIFFVGLITALVIMFAFAGLLFVFNKVLFKAHTGFAQMAGVSAARALAAMPFVLIGIIAALIDPFLGLSVYGFGTLLGYFFTATALKSCTVGNETKYIYILFLTFACMAIVNVLIIRLTYTWYLPDYIRMSMDSLNGLSGLFG